MLISDKFNIPYERFLLQGDVLRRSAGDSIKLLLLHGAGRSTREKFYPLRAALAHQGIASAALDLVGHGETGGEMKDSSLKSRTEQACAVIEHLKIPQPFSVLGSSMGGYNAVKLLEHYEIENLILLVPAMYHRSANTVPFGEAFSRILRSPQSWVDSDAWGILETYRGRLLLITAGRDEVIPPDVLERIYASARNASIREQITVAESAHMIMPYFEENPQAFEAVLGRICDQFTPLV